MLGLPPALQMDADTTMSEGSTCTAQDVQQHPQHSTQLCPTEAQRLQPSAEQPPAPLVW